MVAAEEDLRVEVVDMAVCLDAEAEGDAEAVVAIALGRLKAVGLDPDRNHLASAGYNRPGSVLEGVDVAGRRPGTVMTWSENALAAPVESEMSLFGTGPEGARHQRWTSTPPLSERGMHGRNCLAGSCGPAVRRTLPWEWSAWVVALAPNILGSLELSILGHAKSK